VSPTPWHRHRGPRPDAPAEASHARRALSLSA
jgi:hypothetical protein